MQWWNVIINKLSLEEKARNTGYMLHVYNENRVIKIDCHGLFGHPSWCFADLYCSVVCLFFCFFIVITSAKQIVTPLQHGMHVMRFKIFLCSKHSSPYSVQQFPVFMSLWKLKIVHYVDKREL